MFKWYMTQETNKYREKKKYEIVREAPGDNDLGPTDYAAAEREMNDANQDGIPDPGTEETVDDTENTEEDLAPDDYTDPDDPQENPDTGVEDTTDEETGDETTDGLDDTNMNEENPVPERDGDKTKNTYLIRDFMNLYFTTLKLIDKVNNIKKTSLVKNTIFLQVARNLSEMTDTLYDYIVNNFSNSSYVFNLYQFNLFLEVLNVNVEILKKCGELPSNK